MEGAFDIIRRGVGWVYNAVRFLFGALFRPTSLVVILLISAGFVQVYHPEHVPEIDQSPEQLLGGLIVYTGNESNATDSETVVLSGGESPSYSLNTPSEFNRSGREEDGTIPGSVDSDRDGLTDEYEIEESQTDPMRKTLLIRFFDGTGDANLSQRDETRLKTIFANMPVKNPDGTTGIDLVVLSKNEPLDDGRTITLSNQSDMASLYTRGLYDEEIWAGEECEVHMVTLVDIGPNASYNGFADSPGYSAIVDVADPGRNESYARAIQLKTIVHELLHNIVGEIGDSGQRHTEEGWLSGERNQRLSNQHYMTKAVAQDLTNGFYTDSKYSASATC